MKRGRPAPTRRRALSQGVALALSAMAPELRAQSAVFAASDLDAATKLRERGLADSTAWRLVQSLCTEVGARPAGSEADARAAAWAERELARLGLANVRAEPLPIRIWQRGPTRARLLPGGAGGSDAGSELVVLALGNSVATLAEGITAELAAYPSLQALRDDTSGAARGRIVFIDQPVARTRDGSGYGAVVGTRFGAASVAARQGALAVLVRSLGTSGERIAHTGSMGYDLAAPRIPAAAISMADADRVASAMAAASAANRERPRIELTLQSREGIDATTRNVIAEVPGGELADQIVLIGAHLDSWDVGQGAIDDGAGVAIVSAAAGLIAAAGLRPRRTIRVVLFANEENGFDGARHYGTRYAAVKHQLVGESDFGAGAVWRLRCRVADAALPAFDAIAGLLAPLGVAWAASPEANRGSPGPDAALLMRRHRWPGVELSQDGTSYFDAHHSERDTLERIDPAALRQNVACWAVTAWLAAQSPLDFGAATL